MTLLIINPFYLRCWESQHQRTHWACNIFKYSFFHFDVKKFYQTDFVIPCDLFFIYQDMSSIQELLILFFPMGKQAIIRILNVIYDLSRWRRRWYISPKNPLECYKTCLILSSHVELSLRIIDFQILNGRCSNILTHI